MDVAPIPISYGGFANTADRNRLGLSLDFYLFLPPCRATPRVLDIFDFMNERVRINTRFKKPKMRIMPILLR